MRLFIYLYMKTPHPIAYPSTKALISPLILPHPSKKTAFGSPDLFVSLISMRGSRVLERVKGRGPDQAKFTNFSNSHRKVTENRPSSHPPPPNPLNTLSWGKCLDLRYYNRTLTFIYWRAPVFKTDPPSLQNRAFTLSTLLLQSTD